MIRKVLPHGTHNNLKLYMNEYVILKYVMVNINLAYFVSKLFHHTKDRIPSFLCLAWLHLKYVHVNIKFGKKLPNMFRKVWSSHPTSTSYPHQELHAFSIYGLQ